MSRPWRTITSDISYSNLPFWEIRKDRVVRPDETEGYYQYIERGDFAVAIPLIDNDQTYLVRQWRYPVGRNSWEFSMGDIKKGETPAEAAQRELEEETGLRAGRLQQIGYCHLANALTNQAFYVFIASDIQPGKQQLETGELDMIVRQLSLADVKKMVGRGEILDAPTIASIYYLDRYLHL